jgi:magnesium-transporting ATPase (P-type)
MSAGTRSPARRITISPGTRSRVGIVSCLPLRWTRHWVDTLVILGVTVINALIGHIQESNAEKSLQGMDMADQGVNHRHAEDHQGIDPVPHDGGQRRGGQQQLSSADAAERLNSCGPNALPEKKGKPAWLRFLAQLITVTPRITRVSTQCPMMAVSAAAASST